MLLIKSMGMVIILFFLFLIMFVHMASGKQLDSLRGIHHRQVRQLGGNLILSVKESRVALDKTMAMRIMV